MIIHPPNLYILTSRLAKGLSLAWALAENNSADFKL